LGYSTIIAAAFAAIIMLTGLATILTTGITSMDTITSSISEQVATAEEKLGEECTLGKIVGVDSHTYRVNVTNTGDSLLSVGDLSKIDILAIYEDAFGQATRWIAYDQNGSGEYWRVRGVYFDGGAEITNPTSFGASDYGIWDPMETMEVEVHLNATVTEFESILITLPGGFRAIQSSSVTSNWGEAVVLSGQLSLTVYHGLTGTPKNIQLTPQTQVTGTYWVSNINTTSFRINLSHKPGINTPFFWYCQR